MNDSANIHLCLRCTTPRASRCVCVCVCYMCMCAYPFRRPPLVCESGSKSKPLHLRNSIPAPALQNRGNIPVLILPVQPPRWHSQPQILYLWDGGRADPTPPHPPCPLPAAGLLLKVCVRSLVTVLALDQGWVSGCRGRQPQGSCCPRGGRRHLSYGFKGTRGFSFCGVSLHSVKHSCACSSTQSALRFIVIKSSHVWKL